jgi:hypothetical protein
MWQPDGWGQIRIGVLTPHADVGPESEFHALAPDGISINPDVLVVQSAQNWHRFTETTDPIRNFCG